MKKTMLITAVASAVALFGGAATADHISGPRTVVGAFEFYALGHGDVAGACPFTPPPPVPGALQSCVEASPAAGEDHVELNVVDSQGTPVYFTVQQEGNPNFGFGCGTLTSHPAGFPIHDRSDVLVSPWAGPGVNDALDPGGTLCSGSVDTALVQPGSVGTVTFTFHDHVIDSIPPSPTPVDLVTEFSAAMAESAEDSQAYNSTNVSSSNGASCSITPYDATAGSFRGAGFGTEQKRIENVPVEAVDFALFQVECFGQDTNAFTANANYWFEYRSAPDVWQPVWNAVEGTTVFRCAADSQPGGGVRTQAAAFTVPGSLDPQCDFRLDFRENDPDILEPHRLHVHLTTTNGVDMHGISMPWPSRTMT